MKYNKKARKPRMGQKYESNFTSESRLSANNGTENSELSMII